MVSSLPGDNCFSRDQIILVVGRAAGLAMWAAALTRAMGPGVGRRDQEPNRRWRDNGSLAAQLQKLTAVDFFICLLGWVLGRLFGHCRYPSGGVICYTI